MTLQLINGEQCILCSLIPKLPPTKKKRELLFYFNTMCITYYNTMMNVNTNVLNAENVARKQAYMFKS